MVGLNNLAFWSLVALVLRCIALVAFTIVGIQQYKQFRKANLYKSEAWLKHLLLYFVLVIAISNLPIMYLHYVRIQNIAAPALVTSFATVTNAASMLLASAILLVIYWPREND